MQPLNQDAPVRKAEAGAPFIIQLAGMLARLDAYYREQGIAPPAHAATMAPTTQQTKERP